MAAFISRTIKFHEAEHEKGHRFETPISFIPSIATSMGGNERDPSLLTQITNQEKEKKFLYEPIELVESYNSMLTSYDSLLVK